MRLITIFSSENSSNFVLNLCARIAREGKKVLYVNVTSRELKESEVGLSIASFISSPTNDLKKHIIPLEDNLDTIKGSSKLFLEEFNHYEKLMTFQLFEHIFRRNNYDYIFFEVFPLMSMLTLNSLFASTEVMCVLREKDYSFAYSLSSFLLQFNKLYTKKILLTKIIPNYQEKLDRKLYSKLVFDFSSRVISFPFCNDRKSSNFAEDLQTITVSILEDEDHFDIHKERDKKVELEYLGILERIISGEK